MRRAGYELAWVRWIVECSLEPGSELYSFKVMVNLRRCECGPKIEAVSLTFAPATRYDADFRLYMAAAVACLQQACPALQARAQYCSICELDNKVQTCLSG